MHEQMRVVTHSQFVDDTIIFGEATIEEAKCIMNTLDNYLEQSGQIMNKQKSQVIFLNTTKKSQQRIANLMGIEIADLPLKYLGVRIDKGCRQSQIWDDVKNSCLAKSDQWKNRWLSQVGRLTMVKSVLLAIPIYSMSCFKLPYAVGKNLDNILRKFVWEGAKETRKIPLINWDTMCLVKEED
ncbi:uncharacterized protein LOC131857635 [Cryptomeria japonica]|uniref:uncharacterized protein LOC131857635 n=1 Tax=Cryptomeria japonica TaxID=3369 RepID=UPI0027DA946E|nr:uncharacterized protein LOC131857635 [Cryptomeria japonica]